MRHICKTCGDNMGSTGGPSQAYYCDRCDNVGESTPILIGPRPTQEMSIDLWSKAVWKAWNDTRSIKPYEV